MAIRQPPSSIKDANLRGFLSELRNAIGKTSDQVTKLMQVRSVSGGGGGGGGGGEGPGPGPNPPEPPQPPQPPKTTTVVLTIDPARPTINNPFTLTATVTGDNPTGTVQFRQDGALMTADPVPLSSSVASTTATITSKGTYTFIAEYSGDTRNLSATSNTLTVQLVSNWDGKPSAPSALSASTDDPFQIYLKWSNPYIGDYAVTEIWGVKQNPPGPSITINDEDISDIAVKLGEVASTDFILTQVNGVALDSDENWYFWVRNRDTENLYSDWNATAGTNGKTGTQPGKYLDILTGSITETHLFSSLGSKIDLIVPLNSRVNTVETDIISLQNEDINLYAQLSLVSAGGTGFDTAKIWHFENSSDITGWTVTNASALSVASGVLTFTPTAAASSFSTGTISVAGGSYSVVKVRIKRVSGTEDTDWSGKLTYHYGNTSSFLTIAEPTYDTNGWATAEWDLTNEANWTGNTIIKLQVALGTAATSPYGGVFKVDWMAVGRNAPSASVAQVVDLASAQIGYCLINGSASGHESKSACEAAGGVWYGNYPLAQSVKQVSVTDGVSTGTLEQKFTAQKTATDGLRLQYTVKIDNNGYVSGFGLASDPVNGVPYSDFMVRADRFSISSPDYPTWTRTISSLTRSSTTATCTTSTAHGYATGDTVIIRNAADGKWNGTFTITVTSTTQFTFTVDGTATTPAVAATGKSLYLTKVMMPFIVTTTSREINGITVPPGVYIDSAYIAAATITEAQIRDAAITNAKIGNLIKSDGFPDSGLPSTPFTGWRLDKAGTLTIFGGLTVYDPVTGVPSISAGKINLSTANTQRLILTASNEVFSIGPAPTNTPTPSTITLTATASNLGTPTVSWSVTSGTYTGSLPNGLTQTISPASMTTSVVTFKASCTVSGATYEDVITLAKLQEGSSALTMLMSNESDTAPANADGSLTGTVTLTSNVKVLRGSKNVLYGADAESGWSVALTTTPTPLPVGVTAPSFVQSTGTLSVPTVTASPDRLLVTVTATKGTESVSKVMTVTKQKQGATGAKGDTGTTGTRGSRQFNLSGFSSWTNAAAAAANTLITVTNASTTGGYLVISDTVALTDATTDIVRFYNGGTATSVTGWSSVSVKIDGNLLVAGTVGTNALAANQVWAKQITLEDGKQVGTTYPANYIRSSNFTFGGSQGFMIGGDGNAEFNNVKVRGDVLLGGGNQIQNSIGQSGTTDTFTWTGGMVATVSTANCTIEGVTSPKYFRITRAANRTTDWFTVVFARPNTGAGAFLVKPGGKYQFSAWTGANNCSVNLFVNWYDANLTYISDGGTTANDNQFKGASASTTVNATNWKKLAGTFTAPTNATYAYFGFSLYGIVTASLASYGEATQFVWAEVNNNLADSTAPNAPDIIPWSPGGVSLLDTLALRANSVTNFGGARTNLGGTTLNGSTGYVERYTDSVAVTFGTAPYQTCFTVGHWGSGTTTPTMYIGVQRRTYSNGVWGNWTNVALDGPIYLTGSITTDMLDFVSNSQPAGTHEYRGIVQRNGGTVSPISLSLTVQPVYR